MNRRGAWSTSLAGARGPARRVPATAFGVVVAAVGVTCWVVGWQLGWIELMVVAAGCLVALVLAAPFVVGRSRLDLARSLHPQRAMVGEPCAARLTAHNHSRTPMRAVRVVETTTLPSAPSYADLTDASRRVRARRIELDVPRLGPGEAHVVEYELPTPRRGTFVVGPAVVDRSDPAGLLSREVAHTPAEVLWVHPRWQLVRAPSAGFAKDLEGPTADDSPAGDIAFHAVRPYQIGDDPRHVHWMSSARAGQVMVRHYVDTRRPHVTVVVDGDPAAWAGAEFETGVEVAASITVSLLHHRLPVAATVGSEWIVGRTAPVADHDAALDRLTTCAPSTARPLLVTVADALHREPATSAIVVVTARAPAAEVVRTVAHARRHARVVVADCCAADEAEVPAVPGARTIRCPDLTTFVGAWNRLVAR
ncbi:MAG: DUF58 domain-containing protein [Ilumatobacteraceae bacterium]